ncbi:MAG: quinol:electron acceptor oxidoreductase subunit ActD [Ignavibacteriota bacterium]
MIKPIYGLIAEFENPTALVNAARAAREQGYRNLDAYSPFPIEELNEALHLHGNKLPLLVLVGGIVGGTLGVPAAVLRDGGLLSHQHRRPAAAELAFLRRDHF